MTTNLTFDFNCIISVENNDVFAKDIQRLIDLHEKGFVNISVPAISGNEKSIKGEYPESINHFIDRIIRLSKRRIEILSPMAIWGMCFWDYCIWYDEAMVNLDNKIHQILFPNIQVAWIDYAEQNNLNPDRLDSRWRNPKCDVISLWCHIYYCRDIFITNDANFHKQSKKQQLIALGSKKILRPTEAITDLGM